MKQDFAQLYTELGLRPGCTLVELKRAYRRRVAELHPDRASVQSPPIAQNLALPDLIALYTAAIHFHRQYGRLPGGLHVRNAAVSPMRTATRRAVPPVPPAHEEEPKLPFARTLIIAILLIALLLLLQTSWDRLAVNVSDNVTRTPMGFLPDAPAPIPVAANGVENTVPAEEIPTSGQEQPPIAAASSNAPDAGAREAIVVH